MSALEGRRGQASAAGRLRKKLSGQLGATTRKGALSLIDQTLVSGTRLATTILIARLSGADELGLYAIGFSVILLLSVFQESLMLSPYAVFGQRESDAKRRRLAGSVLIHQAAFALAAVLGLACIGALLHALNSQRLGTLLLVVAATLPFSLLHNFARRFAFAHLRVTAATLLDFSVTVLQLSGMLLLAGTQTLSAATAFGVTAFASAVGSVIWLASNCADFTIRWRLVLPQLRRNWRFGRWLLGSQGAQALGGLLIVWLLTILIDPAAAGIYAACSIVITAMNPVVLGLGNIMEPKTAQAYSAGAVGELLRVVRKVTGWVGLMLACYWLIVLAIGDRIVFLLFDDPIFEDQGHLIAVLATVTVLRGIRIGWNFALRAMGDAHWSFVAGLLQLAVMVLTAVPLASAFGVIGGAYGVLFGTLAGTVARYWMFLLAVRQDVTHRTKGIRPNRERAATATYGGAAEWK